MKQTLESLKKQTKENIETRKDITPKVPRKLSEIDGYYQKYLSKSVGERVPFVTISVKGLNGKTKDEVIKFNSAVIPHNNTLLAMAFSKADKLFTDLKATVEDRFKTPKNKRSADTIPFSETEIALAVEGDYEPMSAIECLVMSHQLLQGKNSSLVKSIKKGEMQELNEFTAVLSVIHKALKELRNYHAHILHEPGPLKFENLYGEFTPKHKHVQENWDKAKDWFRNKMEDVKAHLVKSLNKQLNEKKLSEQEIKDTTRVLKTIEGYEFERGGYVTHDALLFIACMFLRKSDAEYFVKKWTRGKKPEGVDKTGHTFFTYYSVRDKKSLQTQNVDLLKFRKIIGVLSTIPEFKNDCFRPFNEFIRQHNDYFGSLSDNAHSKAEKEKFNANCIPVRKSFNPTHWYMDYLNGKGYFNDFKIACYKTPEDRLGFLEENGVTVDGGVEDITALKLKMKHAAGAEKKRLTWIYKEGKKNFLFKVAAEVDDNYCIKNETAIIQYPLKDDKGNEVIVQVNMSSDLLMKWVFADILFNKGDIVKQDIISFIRNQYFALTNGDFGRPGITLPSSIGKAVDNPLLAYTVAHAENLISEKLKQLNTFQKLNESKKAPWKFGAKKKMNIIFDFVHLSYTYHALDVNKNVDDRRHEALTDMQYLDALEFIRFYGRNYSLPEFRNFFFKDKREYFHSIHGCIESSKTLEELYNAVFHKLTEFYEDKFIKRPDKINLNKFIRIFKPSKASNTSDIEKNAKLFSVNQVVLHELINIQKLADVGDYKVEYNEWRSKVKDSVRTTDFSLMRYLLVKRNPIDTNSDFMMKFIMPELLKNNLPKNKPVLLKNEKGKLQGNTSLFNTLMKNKGDELMMWEIAKSYWQKTYGRDYKIPDNQILNKDNGIAKTPYKGKLFFYKLFSDELTLPIISENGLDRYEIKIKPKKFDDEFQYYETKELYNFIKNHHPPKSEKDHYWHFEDLNKEMKDAMAKYLDDVYLVLSVEKEIVQKNYEALTGILHDKLEKKWDAYYFPFGTTKEDVNKKQDSVENTLAKMVFENIHPSSDGYGLDDLVNYRNKILHQQIQPDIVIYTKIKKSLLNYCIKNKIIK